jgi:Zinc finger, C3HC4 type (RING finger)
MPFLGSTPELCASSEALALQCGICLELVMGQQPPSARKFGLLACEHAFCLRCIRSWRGTGDSDATTETASSRPELLHCAAVNLNLVQAFCLVVRNGCAAALLAAQFP